MAEVKNSDRLYMEDCRRAGHCVRGVRAWFDQNGLDFRDFLKNGMPIGDIERMGDGYADQILARRRGREE